MIAPTQKITGHFMLRLAFMLMVGGWASAPARAASADDSIGAERVTSPYTGQTVYEIVSKESGNAILAPGQREPGIYGRGTRGGSILLVPGGVLGVSQYFNGVAAHLSLTNVTQRNEIAVVLDGRLTLLSSSSRPNKLQSFISLGSAENPIVDVNGNAFRVDPIDDASDVTVISVPSAGRPGLFLASIRQKNNFGEGITIAGFLRAPYGPEQADRLILTHPATIIDYAYLTPTQINALIQIGSDGAPLVISRNHLLAAGQPSSRDDKLMADWRSTVRRFADRVRNARPERRIDVPASDAAGKWQENNTNLTEARPLFNVETGALQMFSLPMVRVLGEPFTIIQRIDPFNPAASILVTSEMAPRLADVLARKKAEVVLQRSVDYDAAKNRYRIFSYMPRPGRVGAVASAIAFSDGKPFLLFPDKVTQRGGLSVGLGELIPADVRDLSFVLTAKGVGTAVKPIAERYLLVSYKNAAGNAMTVSAVIEESGGAPQLTDRVYTLSRKYTTAAELELRGNVVFYGKKFLFIYDPLSSIESLRVNANSAEVNDGVVNATNFFYNLTDSSGTEPQIIYLKEKTSVQLAANVAYFEFDPRGAPYDLSGVYMRSETPADARVTPANFSSSPLLTGRLLKSPLEEGKKSSTYLPLDRYYFPESDEAGGQLTLFPMESDARNKQTKFTMLALATIVSRVVSGSASRVTDKALQTEIDAGFGQLEAVKILRGRRKTRHDLHVLLFFRDARGSGTERSRSLRGGVAVYTISYQDAVIHSSADEVTATPLHWLTREPQNPVLTIRDGLVFDEDGQLYFKEKSLHPNDRNYSVLPLYEPLAAEHGSIYPNRSSSLSLRHEELVEDDTSSLSRLMSRWVAFNQGNLFNRLKGLETYVKDRRDKSASRKVQRENEANSAFNAYLEEQAEKGAPTEHRVLLVSEEQKAAFRTLILSRLMLNPEGVFSLEGTTARHFRFAIFDPTAKSRELLREFDKLRTANRRERTLLYVELEGILKQAGIEIGSKAETQTSTEVQNAAAAKTASTKTENEVETELTEFRMAPVDKEERSALDDVDISDGEENGDASGPKRFFPPYSLLAAIAGEGQRLTLNQVVKYASEEPRIPQLILATPSEWRALRTAYPSEDRAGIFNSFKVNSHFLTGSWTLWPPGTSKATKETEEASRRPISREDFQVFPNLEAILESAADPAAPREHTLFIVPDELKSLVISLIQTRWATESRQIQGRWNFRNRALSLFETTYPADNQAEILNNFEAMRGTDPARTPVLLAPLADLIVLGRPGEHDDHEVFRLRDPSAQTATNIIEGESQTHRGASEVDSAQVPHVLWWLAAEGQRIQPESSPNWSLKKAAGRQVSTILVGTAKELVALRNDTRFESRFFDFEKHFHRVNLEAPSDAIKEQLVTQLLARPEIMNIGYEFRSDTSGELNAKAQVVSSFVARVNRIAKQTKLDPTTAFLKAFSEFRRKLLDADWRRGRLISIDHLERMYADIFNVPKNPRSLEATDWLLKFQDANLAAMGIANAGYPSPMKLRLSMVARQWSVTKGPNEAIPMPNSLIVIGTTSTGKTRLFRRTYQYAGLREYSPETPSEEEAGFWIIPVGTLTKDGKAEDPGTSIARTEAQILNLLAINPSAQIVFDDIHKAGSKEVLEWIVGFLNRLFEARNGMITVKRLGANADSREIPVRNIGLGVTVNPNASQTILREFLGDKNEKAGDIYAHLVAAFSLFPNMKIEGSMFARFADRIDMSQFPIEARVPAVVMNLVQSMQSEFVSDTRLRLILPEVLQDLTASFGGAHARELIQSVTQTLTDLPREIIRAPIYIRSLTARTPIFVDGDALNDEPEKSPDGDDAITRNREQRLRDRDVKEYLASQTELIAVRRDAPDTLVDFIAYMLNGFRIHVYNGVLMGAQKDEWMATDVNYRMRLFPQLVAAGMHNIEAIPFVPLNRVNLRPEHLGARTVTQIEKILKRVQELSFSERDMFPVDFQISEGDRASLAVFLNEGPAVPRQRTRLDLMSETTGRIITALEDAFEAYFRASFRKGTPSPEAYIANLKEEDPTEIFRAMGESLAAIYRTFTYEIRATELLEAGRRDIHTAGNYDAARLFMMTVDRAITQMPWGVAGDFMFHVVESAQSNQALSGQSEYQHLLFESKLSPLAPVTPDLVRQTAQASGAFANLDSWQGASSFRQFHVRCEAIVRGAPL